MVHVGFLLPFEGRATWRVASWVTSGLPSQRLRTGHQLVAGEWSRGRLRWSLWRGTQKVPSVVAKQGRTAGVGTILWSTICIPRDQFAFWKQPRGSQNEFTGLWRPLCGRSFSLCHCSLPHSLWRGHTFSLSLLLPAGRSFWASDVVLLFPASSLEGPVSTGALLHLGAGDSQSTDAVPITFQVPGELGYFNITIDTSSSNLSLPLPHIFAVLAVFPIQGTVIHSDAPSRSLGGSLTPPSLPFSCHLISHES